MTDSLRSSQSTPDLPGPELPDLESLREDVIPHASSQIVAGLNRVPLLPFSVEAYCPGTDIHDPRLEASLTEITGTAYDIDYQDKDRAQSEALFQKHYRETEAHSQIAYLIARAPRSGRFARALKIPQELQGEIIGFTSAFENRGPLIFPDDYQHAYEAAIAQDLAREDSPRIVISMIVRDPRFRPYMNKLLSPHRILIASILTQLSCQGAFFLEEQAQPSTQRMMRPGNLSRYWPGSGVLHPQNLYDKRGQWRYETMPRKEVPSVPLLAFFPHQPHTRMAWARVIGSSISDPIKRATSRRR